MGHFCDKASSDSSTDYNAGRIETNYGNGTYTATVTPLISGVNDLHISLNGSPLKGSNDDDESKGIVVSAFSLMGKLLTRVIQQSMATS